MSLDPFYTDEHSLKASKTSILVQVSTVRGLQSTVFKNQAQWQHLLPAITALVVL
jgi:hypothetical protein